MNTLSLKYSILQNTTIPTGKNGFLDKFYTVYVCMYACHSTTIWILKSGPKFTRWNRNIRRGFLGGCDCLLWNKSTWCKPHVTLELAVLQNDLASQVAASTVNLISIALFTLKWTSENLRLLSGENVDTFAEVQGVTHVDGPTFTGLALRETRNKDEVRKQEYGLAAVELRTMQNSRCNCVS